MPRFLLVAAVVLAAGCQSVVGPFQPRKPERVDDPRLTISEQQRQGRARLAYPDDSGQSGPRTGIQSPGVFGR